MTTFTKPHAMTLAEIDRTVEEFAAAAKRAQDAGFDGVQVHISHGYLLNEFITPHTNRRTDQYGGSFENRLRLPREVIRAVRARVGPDYPLLIKLNGADLLMVKGGLDTPELVLIAKALVAEGVDAIEVSCAHYESGFPMLRGRFDGFVKSQMSYGQGVFLPKWRRSLTSVLDGPLARYANRRWPAQEGFNLDAARQFKAALSVPIISVGGFNTPEGMRRALESGGADAVSIARAMIADPFMVKHLRENTTGPRCDYCNQCPARGGYSGLTCFNPALQVQRMTMLKAAGF
jgi:2,4-dienoyl-CoA reductase-like NADH-dependent reductase (Old Yellow Enzyme family)